MYPKHPFIMGLKNPDDPLFALYLPALDRFLMVYHDPDIVLELRYLLSGKLNAVVIEVSRADEYHHTILDNTVCLNWTIRNRKNLDFQRSACSDKILDGRELGLQSKNIKHDDLSELMDFVQRSLQILVSLDDVKKSDLRSIFQKLFQYPSLMNFEAYEILNLHQDDMSHDLKTSFSKRLDSVQDLRKHAIQECREIIYWARDLTMLESRLNRSDNIITMRLVQKI